MKKPVCAYALGMPWKNSKPILEKKFEEKMYKCTVIIISLFMLVNIAINKTPCIVIF